jgi:fibronectin type III domain protein
MRLRSWRIQVAGIILLMSLAGLVAIRQAGKLDSAVKNEPGSDKKIAQDGLPSCWDPPQPSSGEGGQHRASHHSVTLSWKASVPVSKSPRDAVKGYFVYRSRTSQKHTLTDRLNAQPITATACVDREVEPHTTYFYSVRALSQGGAQSIFSHEVKAVVPFP